MPSSLRPTKKQRKLLDFIDQFVAQHGYSPSYREIMTSLGYKSVATVATHIDNLVVRGHLIKREKSARSLELIKSAESDAPSDRADKEQASHEKWLVSQLNDRFEQYEAKPNQDLLNEIYVLVGALSVLGFTEAASASKSRLRSIAQ